MNEASAIRDLYNSSAKKISDKQEIVSDLPAEIKKGLDVVLSHAEKSKGVLTVVMTSAIYKFLHPEQDIRKHQCSIEGGYSGRTFDPHYVTPFLKECGFPCMRESGWLTRSLEQKVPYDENYTGAINPSQLKFAFINCLKAIRESGLCMEIVDYLFQGLILIRNKNRFDLAVPQNLPISEIVALLEKHFYCKYNCKGASRLPVLALYAIYENLVRELKRYEDKKLLPLESHTSADARSGRKGDIDVVNSDGTPYEAVEVKFDIPVSYDIVEVAKEKIQTCHISRYYILSTKPVLEEEREKIMHEVHRIKNIYNCQLVINGIIPTLKYYLRLLDNPTDFIDGYTRLLASDKAVKYEHKQAWNKIVSDL